MRESAVAAAFAGVLALAACGPAESAEPASPDPASPAPDPEPEPALLSPAEGEYTCAISLAGQSQPDATCEVREDDLGEELWLETLDGEVWLSGVVEPQDENSFVLAGDVFCAQGGCDAAIDARFYERASGVYEAEIDLERGALVVEMSR